jgi:triosephosphate isomerase
VKALIKNHMKPYVIANWKLGLDHKQAVVLAGQIGNSAKELSAIAHIVLCPSAISLLAVQAALGDSNQVECGVQNIYSKPQGAFTGETSIAAAEQLGAKYIIIGHSERRKHFHETNEDVQKKVEITLHHKLIPIICVGETYEDRQQQQAEVVVSEELEQALKGISITPSEKLIIAYEPIWAIGTGQAINPEQAKMMGMVIHQKMIDMFPSGELKSYSVIYGGSVDSTNIKSFVDGRVLSGVLVGGASQRFPEFKALVQALGKE